MHCCPDGPWYQRVPGPIGCGFANNGESDARVGTGGGEGADASADCVAVSACAGRVVSTAMCAPTIAWFGDAWVENPPISVSASEEKAKEMKKPFCRSSRIMTASNESISGRPALRRCLATTMCQTSTRSSDSDCFCQVEGTTSAKHISRHRLLKGYELPLQYCVGWR